MEELLIKGGTVVGEGRRRKADILVIDGRIAAIAPELDVPQAKAYDAAGHIVCPGLVDVHVHFRQPGQEEKETILTGSQAAAHGGYTLVCPMPNLDPVPDSVESLGRELEIIRRDAVVDVVPFASITRRRKGREVVDMAALSPYVCGFSDDGSGVQEGFVMEEAMRQAAATHSLISAHCEDTRYAPQDSRSEWSEVKRDVELALKTHCRFHVCHVSSLESVEAVRRAKAKRARVSCETAPHYLTLTQDDVLDDGRFKMNPPLRSVRDRAALIAGIKDGTIEVIATDHAPHTAEEKSRGFGGSFNGIVGLETAFPVLYTRLVEPGIISLEKLIALMSVNPRRIFGFGGGLKVGEAADIAVFDVKTPWCIDSGKFLSKGRSTPFEGWSVRGRCLLTLLRGKEVWKDPAMGGDGLA